MPSPKLPTKMSDPAFNNILNGVIAGAAILGVGTMLVRGALSERALNLGPDRDLGLDPIYYITGAIGVSMYVMLMILFGSVGQGNLTCAIQVLPMLLIGLLIGVTMQQDMGPLKLGLIPRRPLRDLRWSLIAIPAAFALASTTGLAVHQVSEWFGQPVNPVGHESLKRLLEDDTGKELMTILISAVILAPLLEEPVFRGVLQTCLMRLQGGRRWPALVLTSLLFSVTHAWVVPWQNLVPLFVLGLVFGYVYERTGSLMTAVLTHAGFNAINVGIVVAMKM